jgi:ubiquinone/menaquinone biosynthesis C-methylase UbiE
MPLSIQEWHQRFLIQAQWTRGLRLYFFDLLKINGQERILDIGCGTGATLSDLESLSPAAIYGADIQEPYLIQARNTCHTCHLLGADVHHLPFSEGSFDLCLSHYFLMWVGNPLQALEEMIRVTKKGGYLVSFAEPDYGGRIDFPPEFIQLREYQILGLLEAGADPRMGRKLKSLFHTCGLQEIHCGVYEGNWDQDPSREEIESEWQILKEDLAGILSADEIKKLQDHELSAWKQGSRLIYVPTFYAWGKVPK